MPHQRQRLILNQLQKKLALHPSVGIIGTRQSGKSTLIREILAKKMDLQYFSLDSRNNKERAERNPDAFVEPVDKLLMVIDEVQKVPHLFDSIKLHIDYRRRPGMYLLSGSTEFSKYTGIRESLTGRIGILQLYPFNLAEIHQKTFGAYWGKKTKSKSIISITEFEKKLNQGGMPGFFYLHSESERDEFCNSWIETTCFRDLSRILSTRFDPDLAINIFSEVCRTYPPTATEVAHKLKKDARLVKRYLDGFTKILVLIKITPHSEGVGKDHYLPIDSSFAKYFNADPSHILRTHVLIEALSFFENNGMGKPQIMYYHSSKKSFIPLVFYWPQHKNLVSVQIADTETPSLGDMASLESFQTRVDNPLLHRQILLNHSAESYFEGPIEFHPLRG